MLCDDAISCKGPLLVSGTFMIMYYCFLFGQSLVKMFLYHFTDAAPKKDGKKLGYGKFKYEFKGIIALTLDRTAGNTLEQAIPFLLGLWLHAWFVNPLQAEFLGWWYLASRCIYPIAFYMGTPWLFVSTVPGYVVIFKLWFDLYMASLE